MSGRACRRGLPICAADPASNDPLLQARARPHTQTYRSLGVCACDPEPVRIRYVVVTAVLAGALPVILGPVLPTSDVALGVTFTVVVIAAAFLQARWLNGDEGWNLRVLLARDAWLHPWAMRRERLRSNASERNRLG